MLSTRRLVLVFLAGRASLALAQSPGTFTTTGSLSRPRQFHTATLLTNGKVLITGGFGITTGLTPWASAELYDPSTGTFGPTADMSTPRFYHTATLLPNGKVLIAGGSSNTSDSYVALATSELYDPSTTTFTATGNMTTARLWHTATLLNNGKVLITGGSYAGHNLYSAELYDPTTGTFTVTHDMTQGRSDHTATLLISGKVLIDGGGDAGPGVELYDPDTGMFSLTGPSTYPDLIPAAASALENGKILVTLEDDCDFDNKAEVYDPPTGTFTPTGIMTAYRGYTKATLLPEGKVLIAGRDGVHYGGSAELFDPVAGAFQAPADNITQSGEGHTATLLPDGTVLLSGGWDCCGYSIASAQIYHPSVPMPSPVLFSLAGGVQGAILHGATHQVVSSSNPAVAGEALEIYGSGLIDGSAIPPQAAIGGRSAEVLFFGKAPGFAGLNQINVRVPSGIAPGPSVSVRLNYLTRPSNAVTLAVQ